MGTDTTTTARLFDKPALLFTIGAVCLLLSAGLVSIATTMTPVHTVGYGLLADAASHFCRGGAIFGICAGVYSILPRRMNGLLVRAHFWLSIASVLCQPILVYSFSQESTIPGHSAFSLLMNSLLGTSVASMWVLALFSVAQMVFISNIFYSLLVRRDSVTG